MGDRTDDSLSLLRSMADAAPLAIAASEGASHVLRYVNPAFCRLVGRSAAELLGRPFAEACPEDETAPAWTLLDRVLETGTAESLADLSSAAPGSNRACWSFAAWPLLDPSGLPTQVADTTERHLAAERRETELQGANQQLLLAALREDERSERLLLADRAKDEFLAMLAHELRNPLAAIRAGIYLLDQRSDPLDIDTRRTCALLERQTHHLSRLLEDLLDVSRITRGKIDLHLAPVDVVRTVQEAAEASRFLLELNRHELSLALPPEPVWVEADPVRLDQVVNNLLQNAIKYMEPGGKVWLSVEVAPGESGPGMPPGAGAAVIRVRDTGIGISPEALPRVFDLFVQGDSSLARDHTGLGIGLTLVKTLVELHGGSVAAYSAGPGQGSEFRVLLPLGAPAARAAGGPEAPAASPFPAVAAGATILLVEDNLAAAATLAEVLELWGYEVRIAHNGITALAGAGAAPPDVVLLDIGLPGMDGYEVARRLRAEPALRETPLIALTGFGQHTDRQRGREAGFDHHLTKPVDLEELRRIIGETAPRTG